MKKLNNRRGMTMAELLIVVAIIVVLTSVAFIAVWVYQRSLGQVERDGIAKEIFIAAQNHLTMAHGGDYYGTADFGSDTDAEYAEKSVCYYVVNGDIQEDSVLGQMLPFGSIDETVRIGGSYIVRYQKDTGLVLDVFYCTRTGSPTRFNHRLEDSDYTNVLNLRGDVHKSDRRDWNTHILGWYGGQDAATLPRTELTAPTIAIHNEEKLYVTVTDPNRANEFASLKLIVTGAQSKAQKAFVLKTDDDRVFYDGFQKTFTVILDDVTTNDLQFGKLTADTEDAAFLPGEDLTVQAVAYSTTALTNVAYSAKNTTNSLFAGLSGDRTTAYVRNIRHLENLDKAISNLDEEDKLGVAAAEQTDNLSWTAFQQGIRAIEAQTTGLAAASAETVGVCDFSGTGAAGYYLPIQPDYPLTYDGKNHSVSKIKAAAEDAGLFGMTSQVSSIRNLELIDFDLTGTATAGALAGTLRSCAVTNVLARTSAPTSAVAVKAPTAGGLIGIADDAEVSWSAASLIVSGETCAGGLIGTATGEINACYSGGHTKNADYGAWVNTEGNAYDVTGGTVGGLVGINDADVYNSYSTCSVSGTAAGGFVGTSSGDLTNCYAAGLVELATVTTADDRKANEAKGAFAAELSGTAVDCRYFLAVNEVMRKETKNGKENLLHDHYLGAVGDAESTDGLTPLDLTAEVYNEFTGAWGDWNPARAYDSTLVKYYSGKYTLRTVDELNTALPTGYTLGSELFATTHYGDWPSPEVFFINH